MRAKRDLWWYCLVGGLAIVGSGIGAYHRIRLRRDGVEGGTVLKPETITSQRTPALINGTGSGDDQVIIWYFDRLSQVAIRPKDSRVVPCSTKCRIDKFVPNQTSADVAVIGMGTINISETVQQLKEENPMQKLALLTASEAPPCRSLPTEVCEQFDYKVALTESPSVAVPVSFAPSSIPIEWYRKPTFCLESKSCIGGAMASVASPTQLEFVEGRMQPEPGKKIRGYWTWELAKHFPVINYSARGWAVATAANKSHLDGTQCFPPERVYCEEEAKKGLKAADWSSRSGAGKAWQGIAKILMGSCYKFSLGYENKQVDGYMTEKFYQGFLMRTLPVYCGPENAKDYAPGGDAFPSFLDCHDYSNASELASHLAYLDQNHSAYLEYFEWKNQEHGLNPRFLELFQRSPLSYHWDFLNDVSMAWVDNATWNEGVQKSLELDEGWPSQAKERFRQFQVWGSMEWKEGRDRFIKSRLEKGETWMCELCKQVSKDRTE